MLFTSFIPLSKIEQLESHYFAERIFMNRVRKKLFTAFFDKFAERYNYDRVVKGGRLFNEYIEMPTVKSFVDIGMLSGKTVLDIGSGIGNYAKFFAEAGCKVIAIDVSEKMISIAKSNCDTLCENIQFITADFEEYELQNNSFDIVIGGFMLSYFDELLPALSKIFSVLKPNGYAVLSMLHPTKMQVIRKHDDEFCLGNYFDKTNYVTDLDFGSESIELNKWNFQEIVQTAINIGFIIGGLKEPVPQIPVGVNYEKANYYRKSPSVAVFKLIKPHNSSDESKALLTA